MPSPTPPPPPPPRPAGPSTPRPPAGPKVDGLYDIDQAALWLNLPRSWVRDRVTARAIPHRRIGRHVRFAQQDLDEIVTAGYVAPQGAPRRDEVAAKRSKTRAA